MRRLRSRVKINLGLRILGRRQDGLHEIESVLFPLKNPADDIYVEKSGATGLDLACQPPIIDREENILLKTYGAFREKTGLDFGARARLVKRVPIGAGLGGGSGDAAIFLKWLNEAGGSPLNDAALLHLAASLGSDVPFFLAPGPCQAEGAGERLQPVSLRCGNAWLAIAWPGLNISAGWAYREYDRLAPCPDGEAGRAGLTKTNSLYKKSNSRGQACDIFALDLHNDLERGVFAHYPRLAALKRKFLELGAKRAAMTGSGACIYGLFENGADAQKACRLMREDIGRVYLAPLKNIGM